MVRTLACHARGRRFEPVLGRQLEIRLLDVRSLVSNIHLHCAFVYASVAQLVEQWTENPRVVGSIPTGGTKLQLQLGQTLTITGLVHFLFLRILIKWTKQFLYDATHAAKKGLRENGWQLSKKDKRIKR